MPAGLQLASEKTAGAYTSVRDQESLQEKWEALPDKDVGNTFADSVSSLFRELPECTADAEVEWLLFKAAVASSAAQVCVRGRILGRIANDGEKATPWWNQEVKDVIRAKKVGYKAWLQNQAASSLHLRRLRMEIPQPSR